MVHLMSPNSIGSKPGSRSDREEPGHRRKKKRNRATSPTAKEDSREFCAAKEVLRQPFLRWEIARYLSVEDAVKLRALFSQGDSGKSRLMPALVPELDLTDQLDFVSTINAHGKVDIQIGKLTIAGFKDRDDFMAVIRFAAGDGSSGQPRVKKLIIQSTGPLPKLTQADVEFLQQEKIKGILTSMAIELSTDYPGTVPPLPIRSICYNLIAGSRDKFEKFYWDLVHAGPHLESVTFFEGELDVDDPSAANWLPLTAAGFLLNARRFKNDALVVEIGNPHHLNITSLPVGAQAAFAGFIKDKRLVFKMDHTIDYLKLNLACMILVNGMAYSGCLPVYLTSRSDLTILAEVVVGRNDHALEIWIEFDFTEADLRTLAAITNTCQMVDLRFDSSTLDPIWRDRSSYELPDFSSLFDNLDEEIICKLRYSGQEQLGLIAAGLATTMAHTDSPQLPFDLEIIGTNPLEQTMDFGRNLCGWLERLRVAKVPEMYSLRMHHNPNQAISNVFRALSCAHFSFYIPVVNDEDLFQINTILLQINTISEAIKNKRITTAIELSSKSNAVLMSNWPIFSRIIEEAYNSELKYVDCVNLKFAPDVLEFMLNQIRKIEPRPTRKGNPLKIYLPEYYPKDFVGLPGLSCERN